MKLDSQISLFTGRELAEAGLQMAVDHAESKIPDWKSKTWELFREFLIVQSEPFLMEEFRQWLALEKPDYEWPPSNRAIGFLPLKAAKENLIIKVGYRKVSNKNAHCTPATIWRRK